MTLKEQFRQKLTGDQKTEIYLTNAEQIADVYALGFAIWLHGQKLEFIDLMSVQQLLSNYKKEKKL